jgi:putative transposase
MTDYRRFYLPGSTWFFTVNLENRLDNHLLVEQIDLLRLAFQYVKQRHPFQIQAVVIMPEHLHCLWTLPPDDDDNAIRWNLLKGHFSRALPVVNETISASRAKRRERGIWQRRFWARFMTSQDDFNTHVDYIHWNPVKHGWVSQVSDWPHSSFHRFVKLGVYPDNWRHSGEFDIPEGEVLE